MATPLVVSEVAKSFTMHLRDGIRLPVVAGVSFSLAAGECAVLGGPSGAGKSSILKMLYGNYSVDAGQIIVTHGDQLVDLATRQPAHGACRSAATRSAMSASSCAPCRAFRRSTSSPSRWRRAAKTAMRPASVRANCCARLNLPEQLWSLPPATFSGGEQQRVNIARGFITDHPILLLDEPTASLDATNRAVVIGMIAEKKKAGRRAARHLPRCRRARRGRRPHHRRDRIRRRQDRRMSRRSFRRSRSSTRRPRCSDSRSAATPRSPSAAACREASSATIPT